MKQEKAKMHYAWKIVIACILMKLGTGGAAAAAVGNFITPIVQELGCKVSQLTMFTSIQAISMALLYTTAARFTGRLHDMGESFDCSNPKAKNESRRGCKQAQRGC